MRYLIQIKQFGYTQIEADSWDDAKTKLDNLHPKDFDMSNDCDIDVIQEMDDDNVESQFEQERKR